MENTVKCDLNGDKDLIAFLQSKKCLPHPSWCTVQVIKEKKRNGTIHSEHN